MIISIDILLYRIVKKIEKSANIVCILGMIIDIESWQTIRFTPLLSIYNYNKQKDPLNWLWHRDSKDIGHGDLWHNIAAGTPENEILPSFTCRSKNVGFRDGWHNDRFSRYSLSRNSSKGWRRLSVDNTSIVRSKRWQNIQVSKPRPQDQDSTSANYGLRGLITNSSKDLICTQLLCNNLLTDSYRQHKQW